MNVWRANKQFQAYGVYWLHREFAISTAVELKSRKCSLTVEELEMFLKLCNIFILELKQALQRFSNNEGNNRYLLKLWVSTADLDFNDNVFGNSCRCYTRILRMDWRERGRSKYLRFSRWSSAWTWTANRLSGCIKSLVGDLQIMSFWLEKWKERALSISPWIDVPRKMHAKEAGAYAMAMAYAV